MQWSRYEVFSIQYLSITATYKSPVYLHVIPLLLGVRQLLDLTPAGAFNIYVMH